jgi:hypothetical protein
VAFDVMTDIFDGFFPSLLKGKWSECLPIKIVDMTEKLYVPKIKKLIEKHQLLSKVLGRKFGRLDEKVT